MILSCTDCRYQIKGYCHFYCEVLKADMKPIGEYCWYGIPYAFLHRSIKEAAHD